MIFYIYRTFLELSDKYIYKAIKIETIPIERFERRVISREIRNI